MTQKIRFWSFTKGGSIKIGKGGHLSGKHIEERYRQNETTDVNKHFISFIMGLTLLNIIDLK